MKMSQQNMRRWRPRHTVGMPRNTTVTKPGREVKAISMGRAISIGGIEKKAADGSSHAAFTPCVIDFQSVYGFRVSILSIYLCPMLSKCMHSFRGNSSVVLLVHWHNKSDGFRIGFATA